MFERRILGFRLLRVSRVMSHYVLSWFADLVGFEIMVEFLSGRRHVPNIFVSHVVAVLP